MTPVILVDELRDYLKLVVEKYWFETNKKEVNKPPQVISGYLPAKKATDIPDFPFILVRLSDGEDADSSTVTVYVVIGTYSEDAQNGWRDPANIVERVRQSLLKKRTLANRFRLEMPLKYELPDEQPVPHWFGIITTKWTIPQLQEELIYD